MRQIVIDTETTGLDYEKGHRIIEIGCVEIIERKITNNVFHTYINPERKMDIVATNITGLTNDFLENKPIFKDIINDLLNFINNANELIIHNANFDTNFINNELSIINHEIKNIKNHIKIIDTLSYARKIHPGKKNNLDALCERYNINTNERTKHGALIDAKLLAKVFIEMTTKQTDVNFTKKIENIDYNHKPKLKILNANKHELNFHNNYVKNIKSKIK